VCLSDPSWQFTQLDLSITKTGIMEPFFKYYIASWSGACLVALALFLRNPAAFAISRRSYWHFLAEPWKLATFIGGTALITLVAPYTSDPTWDHVDGLFMSVLCFMTAPWAVATVFFAIRRRATRAETYVAICAWLFTASWSYDIYLVWRDGEYPVTWFANVFASSDIYLAGGLFWNLEWQRGRGVIFSFMREDWPSRPAETSFVRLLGYAAVLALLPITAVLMFIL
jgi:hypothetical protein